MTDLQNLGFCRCYQCHLTGLSGTVTSIHLKAIMPEPCVSEGFTTSVLVHWWALISAERAPACAPTAFQEVKRRHPARVRDIQNSKTLTRSLGRKCMKEAKHINIAKPCNTTPTSPPPAKSVLCRVFR